MAIREIKVYPDQVLRRISLRVEEVDDSIRELADDMLETIHNAPGVGLAAVQVGVLLRVITIDPSLGEDPKQVMVLINPEIYEPEGNALFEEGCLSVPEYYSEIERAEKIRVKALDKEGNSLDFEASELLARIIQHEIDHLNGKLFIDRMPKVKKDVFKRKWTKEKQEARKA
ncbi:peptide deformylase [bacterium]|nr:peptide deformylase [bacterium]